MKKIYGFLVLILGLAFLFSACQKNNFNEGNGNIRLLITDAPFNFDLVDSALVTITKVEIRRTGVEDGSPFQTIMEDTVIINLLELRNGLTYGLVETDIPSGSYDLIRLYVDHASISIKDHGTYDMKVPSGQQTGIKVFIKPAIVIEGGLTEELLLDMDISRSFVLKGNMNTPAGIKGFNFKPVIRAVNNTIAGRIAGFVADTSGTIIKNAEVWLEKDTLVASTYADTTGYYAIIGIPEGLYSVFATKENFDTASAEVEIYAGNQSNYNFTLTPK